MKIKGLLSELDEIRAQRETAGLQSDHVRVTLGLERCRVQFLLTCNKNHEQVCSYQGVWRG